VSSRTSVTGAQSGFTLIELVVVLTILGVLAAVALPRFTSLQSDARAAKTQALLGSIRAAAAQVKATALVRGVNCNSTAVQVDAVVLEGNARIDTVACYPTSGEIILAANIDPAADSVSVTTSIALPPITTIQTNGGTAGECMVSYTQPTTANGQPTVVAITTGC
jgi:MSHA pilin protein MshA